MATIALQMTLTVWVVAKATSFHLTDEGHQAAKVLFLRHQDDDIAIGQRAGTSPMPDVLSLRVALGEEEVLLRLQRVRYPPLYLVQASGIKEAELDNSKSSVYVDPSRDASIIVTLTDPGRYNLEGSITHKNRLWPLPTQRDVSSGHRAKRSGVPPLARDAANVINWPRPRVVLYDGDDPQGNGTDTHDGAKANRDSAFVNSSNSTDSDLAGKNGQPRREKRQAGSMKEVVEMAFIIDYSDYLKWKQRFPDQTMARIREFYTYTQQTMNNIFSSIVKVDNTIDIKIAVTAFYVITSSSNDIMQGSGSLDANDYLSAMTSWLRSQTAVPERDHYTAFTQHDITLRGSQAAGVGAFGTICEVGREGPNSVSVVENNFGLQVPFIGAHELAHTLGASHDGTAAAAACSANRYNVMTPTLHTPTPSTVDPASPYTFSQCSIDAMKRQLAQTTCTQPSETSPSTPLSLPFTSYSSFSFISKEQQCLQETGYSDLCPLELFPQYSPATMCSTGFLCRVPHRSGARAYNCSVTIPFEGTSCGTQKICFKGRCINAADARQTSSFAGSQAGDVPSTTTPTSVTVTLPTAAPSATGTMPSATNPPPPPPGIFQATAVPQACSCVASRSRCSEERVRCLYFRRPLSTCCRTCVGGRTFFGC